jgi:hypothetical protein
LGVTFVSIEHERASLGFDERRLSILALGR